MATTVSGSSPTSFEIKSTRFALLVLRLKSADLDTLAHELQAFYGDVADFFDDDPVVVDLSALPSDAGAIDFPVLAQLLRARKLHPVAARSGSDEQMAQAAAAGLAPARDALQAAPIPSDEPMGESAPPPGALVVARPLRSGQQVYARGRDVVLRAMVNPGAEVIADGNIHAYAPLRGRAIAGARGWGEARIFALDMKPELVSIAGVYRTSDEPLPDDVWGRSAMVSLYSHDGLDQLVFEALDPA